MALRSTQQSVGVLSGGDGSLRTTRQHVSVLMDYPSTTGTMRATQQFVEVLLHSEGQLRVTQQWIAVLTEAIPVDAFRRCIDMVGLTDDSEGEEALLHALLHYADVNHMGDARWDNPADEVLRRLQLAGINPNALKYAQSLLNDAHERYARTVR